MRSTSLQQSDSLSPAARSAAIQRLASTTRGALMLLGLIDRTPVGETLRREVVAIARNSPQVEVRDLFERFIPEGERVKRLGDVIDRSALARARAATPREGALIFTTNPAAQCKTCHKARRRGRERRARPDQDRGQVHQARLARPDPRALEDHRPAVCRLPAGDQGRPGLERAGGGEDRRRGGAQGRQGKTIKVPSAEIEQLVPQSRSLMPELLLRDLTAQQVADLLEFLTTLR